MHTYLHAHLRICMCAGAHACVQCVCVRVHMQARVLLAAILHPDALFGANADSSEMDRETARDSRATIVRELLSAGGIVAVRRPALKPKILFDGSALLWH